MNSKLSLMLATGKDYIQSLQSEQGRRVVSVLLVMLALSMFVIGRWSAPTTVLIQQTKAELRLEILQQKNLLEQLSREQETNINALAARLAKLQAASTRLDALQLLLLDRNLEQERTPAGWPVSSGWISSGFGERNDPFTGKKAQHEGLDFAGAKGSEVVAVASGAVVWSGSRQGYGNLLEIDHGNGYITRYAHNDQLLVQDGEGMGRKVSLRK